MSEQSKKAALFREQMGYLRSGVQASMIPKTTGTRENLQQEKTGKAKKPLWSLWLADHP